MLPRQSYIYIYGPNQRTCSHTQPTHTDTQTPTQTDSTSGRTENPHCIRYAGGFKHPDFKEPSTWEPTKNPPEALTAMIMANELELSLVKTRNPHPQNLTRGERSALRNLTKNRDIIIKPADKGSAVVVLNTSDYIKEGERQLNDHTFYQKLDTNRTTQHNETVHKSLNDMQQRGELSGECTQYLKKRDPRTSQLYLLPKIHKGKIPPPGRPIISANASPTERISQFVDFFLQPDLKSIKSYVRDTPISI